MEFLKFSVQCSLVNNKTVLFSFHLSENVCVICLLTRFWINVNVAVISYCNSLIPNLHLLLIIK